MQMIHSYDNSIVFCLICLWRLSLKRTVHWQLKEACRLFVYIHFAYMCVLQRTADEEQTDIRTGWRQ